MKKITLILAIFLCVGTIQAQFFPTNVVKKNSVLLDSVLYYLNTDDVRYVQNTSPVTIGTIDVSLKNAITNFRVTASFDSLYFLLNRQSPAMVKVLVSTRKGTTSSDTLMNWLYPISKISQPVAVSSVSNQPRARTLIYVENSGSYKPVYINETVSMFKERVDSVLGSYDNSAYHYDTATYTVKTYDKHVILNSTTADTLNLPNPYSGIGRSPLVVANIGSGAYFVGGGYTVKDKSGSNVTSITANTVFTFKPYFNGSSYIWLKEY